MSAIIIEGVPYDVLSDRARAGRPRRVGTETEAFSGLLRSTRRAEFEELALTLGPMSIAQRASLKASAAAGKRTVTGDLLGGASLECFVSLGDTQYDKDEATGIYCIVDVSIRQAE